VLEGTVWDVAVDIRTGSPTYGEWFGIELSASNKKQLLIPKGFAHGFAVTSPHAVFFYKCDQYYHPDAERGIHHADPKLHINWPIPDEKRVVSNKDQALPLFNRAEHNFVIEKK
ncbi:MAG: dTDP-4-dehydrorhamnose 3,5-epimerase family protein, partial [Bacteroidales bacterium]|nr:dTDP-4-dehydrorhamnose 3,5-epimerase family protein [Bacteroidales bacterium]